MSGDTLYSSGNNLITLRVATGATAITAGDVLSTSGLSGTSLLVFPAPVNEETNIVGVAKNAASSGNPVDVICGGMFSVNVDATTINPGDTVKQGSAVPGRSTLNNGGSPGSFAVALTPNGGAIGQITAMFMKSENF